MRISSTNRVQPCETSRLPRPSSSPATGVFVESTVRQIQALLDTPHPSSRSDCRHLIWLLAPVHRMGKAAAEGYLSCGGGRHAIPTYLPERRFNWWGSDILSHGETVLMTRIASDVYFLVLREPKNGNLGSHIRSSDMKQYAVRRTSEGEVQGAFGSWKAD